MQLILVIILVLFLFGGGGAWYGSRSGWGNYSFAPFGGIVLLLLVLYVLGFLRQ